MSGPPMDAPNWFSRSGDFEPCIEEVARIERAVAQVFEQRAVENVAARFRYDADLAGRSGTELRRVVARFNAELLNGFKAGLQAESRRDLAVQITGRCVE